MQMFRNQGQPPKNLPAFKIGAQSVEHNDIRRENQKRFGIFGGVAAHGVRKLPDDAERHDKRFAAAGRHFDAIAGEVVLREPGEAQVGVEYGVSFQQVGATAHLRDFVEIDQRFDGLALRVVIAKQAGQRQAVLGLKPEVQQFPRHVGRARVIALAPLADGLADRRNARRGCQAFLDVQHVMLIGGCLFFARHNFRRTL